MAIFVAGTVLSSFHLLILFIPRTIPEGGFWYEASLQRFGSVVANHEAQATLNSQTLPFNTCKMRTIIIPTSQNTVQKAPAGLA